MHLSIKPTYLYEIVTYNWLYKIGVLVMPGFQALSVGLALTVLPLIYKKKRFVKKEELEKEE